MVHIDFSRTNLVVDSYKKQLNEDIAVLDNQLINLKVNYNDELITAENYIIQFDNLTKLKTNKLKYNKKLLKNKIDENRIFGWKTTRIFLVGFGIRLPYLLFSIFFSYLIFKVNTQENNLKRAFFYLQVASYTISFYVLVWCFWYSQDYPMSAYRFTLIGICGLVALASVYFISYRELFKLQLQKDVQKLGSNIKRLFKFIYEDMEDKNYVKDELKNEYDIDRIEVTDEIIMGE